MLFDTHAHYDDKAFGGDRETVLASLAEGGVGCLINVGASVASLGRIKELTERYDFIYGAVGLHPDEVGPHSRAALAGEKVVIPGSVWGTGEADREMPVRGLTAEIEAYLKELLALPKMTAVGEIGLDYHWNVEPREVQIDCFRRQIAIAISMKKPILVHSRTAAADTLRVIEEMYGSGKPAAKMAKAEAVKHLLPEEYSEVPGKEWVWRKAVPKGPGADLPHKGIIHAYAYSVEQARIYTEMGFLLGIGGVVTYQNSRKLKKVVQEIPLTKLVLETDCPYLAPEPHRGERNDSRLLKYVAEVIADIKDITREEVERVTWENAMNLFFPHSV